MNNNKLEINSQEVIDLLEEFKVEISNLSNLITKIDDETKKVKESWQGEASEAILARIDNLKGTFEDIKLINGNYVNFVNASIAKYEDFDNSEKQYMASNKNAFDTSLYGSEES